jgi:hypothetical protein
MAMWPSWMRGVSVAGTASSWWQWGPGRPARGAGQADHRHVQERAARAASTTFGEFPLVVMARRMSPGRPRASTWRLKISS